MKVMIRSPFLEIAYLCSQWFHLTLLCFFVLLYSSCEVDLPHMLWYLPLPNGAIELSPVETETEYMRI